MSREAIFDVLERALRTFIQVFIGLYTPVLLGANSLGGLIDLSIAEKAAVSGIAAVLALFMGAVGTQTGSSEDNASVL